MTGNITRALRAAVQHGGVDGEHHKRWAIDRMVRALLGSPDQEVGDDAYYRAFVTTGAVPADADPLAREALALARRFREPCPTNWALLPVGESNVLLHRLAQQLDWTIDQMVRALCPGDTYAQLVAVARGGVEGPETYGWNAGTAPAAETPEETPWDAGTPP